MRKLTLLLLATFVVLTGFSAPVSLERARTVADNYFGHFAGKSTKLASQPEIKMMSENVFFYIFNYADGGFVVVSGDDASTPVLAQSNQGSFEVIPPVQFWLEAMTEEIDHLITSQTDNTGTLAEWNRYENNQFDRGVNDVGPLCTTTWDQNQWYNYYCPTDDGPAGKAYTGCVATAMGQIMKKHNYPAQGYGSNSYYENDNGVLTVNFGATTYNWSSMGNTATSGSYQAIATLLYHLGISVYMDYGGNTEGGSGAFSEDVSWALTNYFNYDPLTIAYNDKTQFTNPEWVALLKADLDLGHPIYYAGTTASNAGHAWVCDGYRTSDDKFHMNWGWSGASNGYFAVTANMSAGGWTFTKNFRSVTGIQPQQNNIFVRINDVRPNQMFGKWKTLEISGGMVTGSANMINILVDDEIVYTTNTSTFSTTIDLSQFEMGHHLLKAEATVGADKGYHIIPVVTSDWESQNSGFPRPSRGVKFMCAVDQNVVWATGYDGSGNDESVQEVIKTTDGGQTWTSYTIAGTTGLDLSMVYALDANKAWACFYKTSGSNPQGIYVTTNGGTSWTRQASASFSNAASFPNVVHFFNENDGFCMGDPINSEYELYTTTNGGATWTLVPGANIPAPVSGEFGIVGYYSAVGDNIWFGTNKGRVYRSNDKGLTWQVSATTLGAAKYTDVEFRNELHGLAQDKSEGTTGALSETTDGGVTWQAVSIAGQIGTNDLVYVPGTDNTWVSTEAGGANGAFYSYDGGRSWATFDITPEYQFLAVDFVDNEHGWAGFFSGRDLKDGMFGFTGILEPTAPLEPVTGVFLTTVQRDVYVEWLAAGAGELGYNVYRNNELITPSPVTELVYLDTDVPNGHYNYCVTAVYTDGESVKACEDVWITLGVQYPDQIISVYPNPATTEIRIDANNGFDKVRILNVVGQEVYSYNAPGKNLRVLTEGFKPGMYVVQIMNDNKTITRKISVK